MAEKIPLPNNKTLVIPDDISAQDRALLRQQVQARYNIDIDKSSVLEQAINIPKDFARGVAGSALLFPEGIASLTDIGGDSPLVESLRKKRQFLYEESPLKKNTEGAISGIAEALGSASTFAGAGLGLRAATRAASLSRTAQNIAPFAAFAITGPAQQQQLQDRARALGEDVSPFAEVTSDVLSLGVGASEAFPIQRLFGRMSKGTLKNYNNVERLKSFGKAFITEGGQEAAASIAQDLIARGTYSDQLPIGESLVEELFYGGTAGGIIDAVFNTKLAKRGIENERYRQQEEQLRENKANLTDSAKFDLALQQGKVEELQPEVKTSVPEITLPEGEIQSPTLTTIENANGTFSVIDSVNVENPVIETFPTEAEAIVFKTKENNRRFTNNIELKLKNDLYDLGLINSDAGFKAGQTMLDPNAVRINASTIFNYNSAIADNLTPEQIKKKFEASGLEKDRTYTFSEAKTFLKPKDFDLLLNDKAEAVLSQSEKSGIASIRDNKNEVITTPKYIKSIAETKNLENFDFKSPAVQAFSEAVTGYKDVSKIRSKGAKKLFLARLNSLEPFNQKTVFPDFRDRKYTANDLATFVANMKADKKTFTKKEIESFYNDEKLFTDLINSGRIKRTKGSRYKVVDNFEFEMARKQEGFNETPEEFGQRLRDEGQLDEETINQLISDEQIKQQGFLPPSEQTIRLLDFAETIEEGRKNKFAQEVRQVLDNVGLTDTGIVISDNILSTESLVQRDDGTIALDPTVAEGLPSQYDANTDTIFVALNQINPDGTATEQEIQQRIMSAIDGNIINALREKDLFTEKEYQFLRGYVRRAKVPDTFDATHKNKTFYARSLAVNKDKAERMSLLEGATEDRLEEMYVEEAIADLYRARGFVPTPAPKSEKIFGKIVDFFKGLGVAMRRSSINNANELFARVDDGGVGLRERGQIRTLKEVDRINLLDELRTLNPEVDEELKRIKEEQAVDDANQPATSTEDGTPVIATTSLNTNAVSAFLNDVVPVGIGSITMPRPVRPNQTTPVSTPATPAETDAQTTETVAPYDEFTRTNKEAKEEEAHLKKNLKGKDLIEVYSWLVKNSPSPDYKIIAEKVLKKLTAMRTQFRKERGKDFNFEFVIYEKDSDIFGATPKQTADRLKYIKGNPNIYGASLGYRGTINVEAGVTKNLNPLVLLNGANPKFKISYDTLLHEGIHAATQMELTRSQVEGNKDGLYQKLENLRRAIKRRRDNIEFKGEGMAKVYDEATDSALFNALKNPDELLAWGLTNRKVQKFMEDTNYNPKTKDSLWTKFVREIRRTLGLQPQQDNALSRLLRLSDQAFMVSETKESKEVRAPPAETANVPPDIATENPPATNAEGRPLKAVYTQEFKRDPDSSTEFESNYFGEINGYKFVLSYDRDASQGFRYYAYPNGDSQIVSDGKNSFEMVHAEPAKFITLVADNLAQAKEQMLKQFQSLLDNGYLLEPNQGRKFIRMDKLITLGAKKDPVGYQSTSKNLIDVIKNNPEGFTVDILNPEAKLEGIAVAPLTRKVGEIRLDGNKVNRNTIREFVKNITALAKVTGQKVYAGGWYSTSEDVYILDAVQLIDTRENAIYTGLAGEQEAAFDLQTFEEINIADAVRQMQSSGMFDLDRAMLQALERDILEQKFAEAKASNPDNLFADFAAFGRAKRYADRPDTSEKKQLIEATEKAEILERATPNGQIPSYNTNASDIALKTALDFNSDPAPKKEVKDIPFEEGAIPEELTQEAAAVYAPSKESFGKRLIDAITGDRKLEAIRDSWRAFRTQYIDSIDRVVKLIAEESERNEAVRELNLFADTATVAALRLSDKSRGVFQQMLSFGTPSNLIEGEEGITKVNPLKISTRYNPFVDGNEGFGGFTVFTAPLYADPSVNKEAIFGVYGALKRKTQLDENGREVPVPFSTAKIDEKISFIENTYPEVVEVYENYQKWNNDLIEFAKAKGLLSDTANQTELVSRINDMLKDEKVDGSTKASLKKIVKDFRDIRDLDLFREQAGALGVDIRGTAQIWQEHSSYYPFYRKMIDDSIAGPLIAGGSLPQNPLSIKLEGSENPFNINPIEGIARNSLSILTAALKNDGTAKLLRDMSLSLGNLETEDGRLVKAKIIEPANITPTMQIRFAYVNGEKIFYQIDDPLIFEGLQTLGGVDQSGILSMALAKPAGFLRDMVTRDPGFMVANLIRDTLSVAVTSGAPINTDEGFTPVLDTFKKMFGDISTLERFGIVGGYDFQNDEGSVKDFIRRSQRKMGVDANNASSLENLFYTAWDALGAWTTQSDGATRMAVYDAVYNKLKESGASEARAQSEAAYQALEIINFGRRGLSPTFRILTSAIPFLNARIQGLDVLGRAFAGNYSSMDKLGSEETLDALKKRTFATALSRGLFLVGVTALYYLLFSDTDEYKGATREERDDNWIIPVPLLGRVLLPIPFEVGLLFKTFPERFIDEELGRQVEKDPAKSVLRGLGTSLNVPILNQGMGIQLVKPLAEYVSNKNSFTRSEIVPFYQSKLEPELQTRPSTNALVNEMAQLFGLSPIKLEHVLRGYTGTLGGYVLDLADVSTRLITGQPVTPPNATSIPFIKRVLRIGDRSAGGLQQQFYELRSEVDTVVQSMNLLKEQGRQEEYLAYRNNMQGVINVKSQVRALERYMKRYRKKRDRILTRDDISPFVKAEMLRQLEAQRDRRLAVVPELRDRADIPLFRI